MAGIRLRALVGGADAAVSASLTELHGHRIVRCDALPTTKRGALSKVDGDTIADAAGHARRLGLPFVVVIASSGADVAEGIAALHGWGLAAAAMARLSGIVPVVAVVDGPAVSGPALLLGLADVTVFTTAAYAFMSGPAMVAEMTGVLVPLDRLGGSGVHARRSGVASLVAPDLDAALELVAGVLDHLPPNADTLPAIIDSDDPVDRDAPELATILPASRTGAYDVRDVARAICDDGEILELWSEWSPNLVTAFSRIGGKAVGIVANQPCALAGTLDIPASQKGARFVDLCDSHNVAIITLVDTPGFFPGKDLEWRGMIRKGAQLAFAYARARVPRVCVVLRKAYGGAYIVMDCKTMGNDLCVAWPSAEIAVMGAKGAAEILHRRATPAERAAHEAEYEATLLTPWIAAERGLVDAVIEPIDTRRVVAAALEGIIAKRDEVVARKHDNGPL